MYTLGGQAGRQAHTHTCSIDCFELNAYFSLKHDVWVVLKHGIRVEEVNSGKILCTFVWATHILIVVKQSNQPSVVLLIINIYILSLIVSNLLKNISPFQLCIAEYIFKKRIWFLKTNKEFFDMLRGVRGKSLYIP